MAISSVSSGPVFSGFSGKSAPAGGDLSEIHELRQRDALVRRYISSRQGVVAGSTVGPEMEFARGPDGRSYAVEANVVLSVQEVPGDPQGTIRNARTASRVAMAPPMIHAGDNGVLFEARELEARARAEIERIDQERKALYSADGRPHQPQAQALFSILG